MTQEALRVAIVNAVYPPEPLVSARIGADVAQHLARGGHRVTVLCPYPTRPHGLRYPDFTPDGAGVHVADDHGVTVVRLPSFTAPKSRLLTRMWESFSFGRHSTAFLQRQRSPPDVVYVNTWPLLGQAMVARYCARHDVPLVLHIQDVYPESLLNKVPRVARLIAARPLTALDRAVALRAARLVVISPGMERTYLHTRAVPPERMITIPNWQDEANFDDVPPRSDVCARNGVPDEKFTFVYLGNIGPVAGVDLLIDAFAQSGATNSQLLIIGDGSDRRRCEDLVRDRRIDNVRFLSCPPTPTAAPTLQQMADVCLLPVRGGAGLSSIPSKLIAYLLSSKPVLATVDIESDTARCIVSAGCGWVGPPGDAAWLSERMRTLAETPAVQLEDSGRRGRQYALQHLSKTENVARLGSVITDAVRNRRAFPARAR